MDLKKYTIGMRTIKTGLAVAIGLLVAEVFNLQSPLFVGIGAISTMQSSVSQSFVMGKNRMLGTVTGAIVALLFALYLPRNPFFLGLGIIIVIHILNLLDWKKSISLSAIVFLAVSNNHGLAMTPYAISRVLDTFIGIVIAVIVNYFIAAPNNDILFNNFVNRMLENAKTSTYKLVVGKQRIDLLDFKEELLEIEKLQDLIQQETKINIVRNRDKIESEITIRIIQDIYNDLSALQMMQYIAIVSPDNLDMLQNVYSITPIWEKKAIMRENDIIFNYHLQRLLKNILFLMEHSQRKQNDA
ncbi:FUSC family protein [Gudongella sp. DL1XJH-153]|uniref:FUSC family protein n=1 Tax=Gudongella sp. DL1XJH-153 TaxID=3409804 RepID=UPI003BB6E468